MEQWNAALDRGQPERAWDRFLERYRRLIFATIRHYVQDYDDVMDVFAHVCEALHADDLARLRSYTAQREQSARFSTWLVAVIRNLVIDWFRRRDGRRRLSVAVEQLPQRQRDIFEEIAHRRRTHVEAFEVLRARGEALTYAEFCREVSALYRSLAAGRRGRLPRELIGMAEQELPEPSHADAAVEADRAGRLGEVLATLDTAERAAIRLYIVEGLPASEVARLVGWATAKTVYNRVYRALATVRERLEGQGIGRGDL